MRKTNGWARCADALTPSQFGVVVRAKKPPQGTVVREIDMIRMRESWHGIYDRLGGGVQHWARKSYV